MTFNDMGILGVASEALWYTNTLPTKDSVKISAGAVTSIAGKWNTVAFNLQTADGRLYAHTDTNGYYTDISSSIRIDASRVAQYKLQYKVTKGAKRGSYLLHFMTEKTQSS